MHYGINVIGFVKNRNQLIVLLPNKSDFNYLCIL